MCAVHDIIMHIHEISVLLKAELYSRNQDITFFVRIKFFKYINRGTLNRKKKVISVFQLLFLNESPLMRVVQLAIMRIPMQYLCQF